MKTKEEIAAGMRDHITVGQCFFGEEISDADRQVYLHMNADIRGTIGDEHSVTAATKKLFDEVLGMRFNELQWLGFVLIISTYIDLAEQRGVRKVANVMDLLSRSE